MQVFIVSEIKRINYLPPVKRIYWVSFLESEMNWLGLFPPSLSLCTKRKCSSLLHRVIPVKHIQVLLGSLPNISCTAIKASFRRVSHNHIWWEPFGAVTLLGIGTSKATLSSLGESQAVNSFWCGVQSASLSPFTRWLLDEAKAWIAQIVRAGVFPTGMLVNLCFSPFNNAGRWMRITALTRMDF